MNSFKPHPIIWIDRYFYMLFFLSTSMFYMLYINRYLCNINIVNEIISYNIFYIQLMDITILAFILSIPIFFTLRSVNIRKFVTVIILLILELYILIFIIDREQRYYPIILILYQISVAILVILYNEFFRRSYVYKIENDCVRCSSGFLINKEEIFYLKRNISQILLKQTLIERLFKCYTIILIPNSGMNLNIESISTGFLFYRIEQSSFLPRALPKYCLSSIQLKKEEVDKIINMIK